MLGTKKRVGAGEEYRWILLGTDMPPRSVELCRRCDGVMHIPYIQLMLARTTVYPDLNSAFRGIKKSGFIRLPYTVQVEHFPDELFPQNPSA